MSLILNANYLRKVADGLDLSTPTTFKLHAALIDLAQGFDAHVAVGGQEADTLDDYLAASSGAAAAQAAIDALGIADVSGLQAALDALTAADAALDGRLTTAEGDITTADAAISAEAGTRAAADTALDGRLTTAESDITAADAAISTETTDRTNADVALQAAIDAVDAALTTEVSDRTSGDAGLQASVDAITAILASDDPTLDTAQERVDKIKQLIADVDTLAIVDVSGLQAALDAKATTTTVGALDTRVGTAETDITALQGADTALDGRVTANESDITTLDATDSALDARVTTAEGDIVAETAARIAADSAIRNTIATQLTLTGFAKAESATDAEALASFDAQTAQYGDIGVRVTARGIRQTWLRTVGGAVALHDKEPKYIGGALPSPSEFAAGSAFEHLDGTTLLTTRYEVNSQGALVTSSVYPTPSSSNDPEANDGDVLATTVATKVLADAHRDRLHLVKHYLYTTDGAGAAHADIDTAFANGDIVVGDLIETLAYLPTTFSNEPAALRGGCQYLVQATGESELTGRYYIAGTGYKLKAVFKNSTASPYQFGAKGNRAADDTAALQKLFDCVGISFGRIDFEAAQCLISSTLFLSKRRSFSVFGNGVASNPESVFNTAYPLLPASIIWNGAAGGTMLECSSAEFSWTGVAMFGALTAGAPTGSRAGCLFKFRYETGLGSGAANFGMFAGAAADICFQFGQSAGESTCADVSFQKLMLARFDVGMKFVSNQNVNYVIDHADFTFGNQAFLFEGGGCLNVQHLHFVQVTRILYLNSQSSGIGSSNGIYRFGLIKADANQLVTPEIVYATNVGFADILIDGAMLAGAHLADGRYLFSIGKNVALTANAVSAIYTDRSVLRVTQSDTATQSSAIFRRCTIVGSSATELPTNWNTIELYCDLPGAAFRKYMSVRFEDCVTTTRRPLPSVYVNGPLRTGVRAPVIDKRGVGAFNLNETETDRTYFIDGAPRLPLMPQESIGASVKLVNFTASAITPTLHGTASIDPDGESVIPANASVTAMVVSDTEPTVWRLGAF